MKTYILNDMHLTNALKGAGLSSSKISEIIKSFEALVVENTKGCYMPVTVKDCTNPSINIMPGLMTEEVEEEE